jgi:hypothetical protein
MGLSGALRRGEAPKLSNILRSRGGAGKGWRHGLRILHRTCTHGANHAARSLVRSLRTLSRALEYARVAMPIYGLQRALVDGLSMVRGCAAGRLRVALRRAPL